MVTPVLGFCGWSGSGKTELLSQVIPLLKQAGLRLAIIKHTHHAIDIDRPGKDSYRFSQAGADQILVAARKFSALIVHNQDKAEPGLEDVLRMVDTTCIDLIIVEGYKHAAIAKIEVWRPAIDKPALWLTDRYIQAVVSDAIKPESCVLPWLDINDPHAVSRYILAELAA